MSADHRASADPDAPEAFNQVRLSDWLRDQDARHLALFARAARVSDTSFLAPLLDEPQ